MPIYAFQCDACGHEFDRLQKMSDPDPEACPECGALKIKRQLTAPSFRLSGSGWYETDFKKDSDKKSNLATKDEAPKSESPSSDSSKSESTKPDTCKSDAGKSESAKSEAPKSDSAKSVPDRKSVV